MEGKILMSRQQLKRAHVLRSFNEQAISRKAAAMALDLSERQITRLAKGMKENGENALIHKNTGQVPHNAISTDEKKRILEIRSEEIYKLCNISHFMDILRREHGIKITYSPLYKLLNEAGIKSPKKHRKTKKHRRRKRKASAGEMLQLDATPFDWFGLGEMKALHGAIDDATGKITGLHLEENECLNGYFEVMKHTILTFGVPLSAYSDKHTIFRSPLTAIKEDLGEEANLTQFGRALDELGINIIYANSPQAKGRIERLWETLQSRLPVEFALRGIKTIEEANKFLTEEYIPVFNEQFGVTAESAPIFVPLMESTDLDSILCIKESRKTDSASVFSFKHKTFKVLDEGYPLIPAKSTIEVLISVKNAVKVRYKGRIFETVLFDKPTKTVTKPPTIRKEKSQTKPLLLHGTDEWRKVWHYESYADSLEFIYGLFFKPCA